MSSSFGTFHRKSRDLNRVTLLRGVYKLRESTGLFRTKGSLDGIYSLGILKY